MEAGTTMPADGEVVTGSPEHLMIQFGHAMNVESLTLTTLTGEVIDLSLQNGTTERLGFLSVTLNQCRYPAANPSGDAYVEIYVTYRDDPEPLFNGWMLASSPALEAMDHPRYDIWALRCITS